MASEISSGSLRVNIINVPIIRQDAENVAGPWLSSVLCFVSPKRTQILPKILRNVRKTWTAFHFYWILLLTL